MLSQHPPCICLAVVSIEIEGGREIKSEEMSSVRLEDIVFVQLRQKLNGLLLL